MVEEGRFVHTQTDQMYKNFTKPRGNLPGYTLKLLRAMKLTTLLLCISLVQVSANSLGQNITLKDRTVTYETVFREIRKQTGYDVLMEITGFDTRKTVRLQAHKAPLKDVLDQLVEGTGLTYVLKKHFVVFKEVPPVGQQAASSSAKRAVSAQMLITGLVTDSVGSPLPGVNVNVKGAQEGTVTDPDGRFELEIADGDAILTFSLIGFRTKEVPLNSRTNISVVLEADIEDLDEIVVVGYGTMRKSDLTGAVSSIGEEAFEERPNVSVFQSLQGALPGLNVGQVNRSGRSPSVSIRGRNSIAGTTEPLIVLDGVIFRGNYIDLNPNDVKSIDVLKDASAAAIYGSQASNGVIIITTKKGSQDGKPVLTFSSRYSLQEPAKSFTPESPEEFIQRIKDADLFNSRTEESGYLQPNPDYDPSVWFKNNEQVNAYRNGQVTNWHDLLINDRIFTHTHDLSISNRVGKTEYFLSGGYTQEQGYLINEGYDRWNARVNIDNSIYDWLTVGLQSFLTMSNDLGPTVSATDVWDHIVYAPAYKADGSLVETPRGVGTLNPLYATQADFYSKRLNLFGNVYAQIDFPFLEGLSFKTNYSNNSRFINEYIFKEELANFQGQGSKYHGTTVNWSNDNILSYRNTFGGDHSIYLTLVYGIERNKGSNTSAVATNFVDPVLGYNRLQAGESLNQSVNSGAWEETSLYSAARLFYSYAGKYLFTGTFRRDGFSGFSENNKYGVFPSAAVAWVITEENFLKGRINWLDELKIRATYGSNGNRTVGRYQTLARVGGRYAYLDDNRNPVYGLRINSLASPNLKWETTTGINLGLDFSVLNSRLSGSIEYYNSNTTNLLYNVDLPGISRYTSFPDNLGKLHNHGVEVSLSSINIDNNAFTWSSQLAVSMNRNELRELLGFDNDGDGREDDLISEGLFIGEPLSALYRLKTNGELWQLGEDIPSTADLGSYKIVDINGDGEITPDDRTIVGYRDPLLRFGLQNEFRYKNFTLSFFLNSVLGNKKYYLGRDDMNSFNSINGEGLFNIMFPSGLDYWLPENPNAKYQRLYINIPSGLQAARFVPRTFVRLQDVTLTYNVPQEVLSRLSLKNLQLFFNGKNLYTWTKWPGWDPETGDGVDRSGRPVLRNYTLGLKVRF